MLRYSAKSLNQTYVTLTPHFPSKKMEKTITTLLFIALWYALNVGYNLYNKGECPSK